MTTARYFAGRTHLAQLVSRSRCREQDLPIGYSADAIGRPDAELECRHAGRVSLCFSRSYSVSGRTRNADETSAPVPLTKPNAMLTIEAELLEIATPGVKLDND